MNLNFTAISIFTLAISIIVGAFIIASSINKELDLKISSSTQNGEEFLQKQLLNKEEASEYLGISVEEFYELVEIQISKYGHGIPYLETNNTRYYTIQSIELWLSGFNN